jgi:mannose-6-phosphate isomerase-like protein (cupin superfamily)
MNKDNRALPSFEQFRAQALLGGFDEVLERRWEPGTVVQEHTHPFAVSALVVAGEMWLIVGGVERHLRRGDRFALDAGAPHAERKAG